MENLGFPYGKFMFSRFQAIKIGMQISKKSDPELEGVLGCFLDVFGSILGGFLEPKS